MTHVMVLAHLSTTRRTRGFTLIEILVALAVLAIALAAVVGAASQHVRNLGILTDRTLAHWVGMNEITALRLANDWPALGRNEGESKMAGRRWRWRVKVSETEDASVRRVDIEIMPPEHDEVLSHLIAYLGAPYD